MMNKKIIAVIDTHENKIIPQSMDLLWFARAFTAGDDSRILCIVPGSDCIAAASGIAEEYGIDVIALLHDDARFPNPVCIASLLTGIIGADETSCICFQHSVGNCQAASMLAITLGTSALSGIDAFAVERGAVLFTRDIFNGKCRQVLRPARFPLVATVVAGAFPASGCNNPLNRRGSVRVNKSAYHEKRVVIQELSPADMKDDKLEEADVVISAGRGIGSRENLERIREFSGIFKNSAVGASRPIVDNRWMPYSRQVGVTGKTVSPRLYVACGISGSAQHVAGMKNSQCIIAINTDPNAAIFSFADYIVVENILTFLPIVTKMFSERYQ